MQTTQSHRAHLEAEVLAQKFLLKLGAVYIATPDEDLGLDYLAIFENSKESLKFVGIEVKAGKVYGPKKLYQETKLAARFQNSNLPVLMIHIDIESKAIECRWINIPKDPSGNLSDRSIQINDNSITELRSMIDEI